MFEKIDEIWQAHIPINCLTNKVFSESGLLESHRSWFAHTGLGELNEEEINNANISN